MVHDVLYYNKLPLPPLHLPPRSPFLPSSTVTSTITNTKTTIIPTSAYITFTLKGLQGGDSTAGTQALPVGKIIQRYREFAYAEGNFKNLNQNFVDNGISRSFTYYMQEKRSCATRLFEDKPHRYRDVCLRAVNSKTTCKQRYHKI